MHEVILIGLVSADLEVLVSSEMPAPDSDMQEDG